MRLDPRGNPEGRKLAYIKEIQMKGFKSFGVNKVVIPLARGLNVIVGRNGHGKSNIADAIVFAFGGRSTTMMRAERFQDFLYMRDGKIIAPYAEVTLVIDNSDGALPIMSKMVEISRRVDKSGKCVYRINGKRADRHEIVDILSPVMGSPDGMNFVLQDQVKRIFSLTPEERREIIEDLAGVKEYNERREKAEKELLDVENNMRVLDIRIKEIRSRVETLRKQAQDCIAAKSIDRELQQVRGALLFKELKEKERELKRLESSLRKISSADRESRNKLNKIKKKLSELEREKSRIQAKLDELEHRGVLARFKELEIKIEEQKRQLEEISRKSRNAEEELRRLEEELNARADSFASSIKNVRELYDKFKQLLSELSGQSELTCIKETLNQISNVLNQIDRLLEEVLSEIPSVTSESSELARQVLNLQGKLSAYRGEEERIKSEIDGNIRKLESMKSAKEKTEKTIERLKKRLSEIEEKVRILNAQNENIRDKQSAIAEKKGTLESRKVSAQQEIVKLQEELSKIKVDYSHLLVKKLETLRRMEAELFERKSQIGEVNPKAPEELQQEEKKLSEEEEKYRRLEEERQQILSFMAELDQKKKDAFFKVFNVASHAFSEIFREISGGADGKLILTNPENPFEGGLDFDVDFGEKTRMLSGGQKTLTAVTFLLALQRCRPSTFYVMDEIDESLDPFNRQRVARLLKKFSRESQMIVITLHTSMAEVADRIFGVVKEDKVSRVFSADLSMLREEVADEPQ